MPSQLGMSPSYYKAKTENVKVSLIISNLVSSLLLPLTYQMAQIFFCKLYHFRKLEPCNAWGKDFEGYEDIYAKPLNREWLTRVVRNLSPVMRKGKIFKFTRISMQNLSAATGCQEFFSHANPSNFWKPLQWLLLRYTAKILQLTYLA